MSSYSIHGTDPLFNVLRGINDSVHALLDLSQALFKAGIHSYYLHQLDPVQGAAHFLVDDVTALQLWQGLLQSTSGYLVPRLVREVGRTLSKTPLLPSQNQHHTQ